MKNKKGNVVVIAIIIVIVAITAAVITWLAATKTQTPEKQAAVTQPAVTKNQPVAQPAPVDETANWKTYRNDKYGFEFEYPNNWIEKGYLTSVVLGGDLPHVNFSKNKIESVAVTLYFPNGDANANSMLERQKSNQKISGRTSFIKVSGLDALKTVFESTTQSVGSDEIYFVRNNGAYTIFFNHEIYNESYSQEERTEIENRVTSTFKFTK